MDTFATNLIYLHATFGGIAFISGFIAMISKKGGNYHKKSGITFYYTMLLSAISALIIAILPKHESPFLFTIGLFSSYFIITGYRALRFKKPAISLTLDKIIAAFMIFTGIGMIAYPLIYTGKLNIVLAIFGTVGIIFATRDFILFKNPKKLRKGWLKLHIGKMLGGYIAAVTAFVVVNQLIPGIAGWLVPSVFGTAYIIYWFRKLEKKPIKIVQ